ncbi:sarcoplasmic reticulum histidine-rich calcium-binding protein-like [Anopheles ziemanni]|uniref:sarcoplasmic reticulum histidine-rich calcium-binding protein-like n=1 Tax=Anopheles coustani TaxID=139045 RepID=UPI002659DE86|nr:sarcoplasmic reticulum histidine-rich calcium-binding protein-like [Anopheles coustani]XP_058176299.1 sarcoplasmic reticulum histidine-rich calcium-binding protein-like [Anopheles ziemanni]
MKFAKLYNMRKAPNVWWVPAKLMILAAAIVVPVAANREHKVHNIVLYPNKQSWCTTRNISQVITEPGCKQVTIDNNVCVGACFSYSIPHTEPSDPGEVIGPYCDSCQPLNYTHIFVKVDCTENPNMKTPYLFKQVELIHNCSCTACEEQSARRNGHNGGHDSADSSQEHKSQQSPLESGGVQEHHHQRGSAHAGHTATGSGESDAHPDSDMIQDDIPEILEVVHYSENDTDLIRHTPVHDFQSHDSGTTYMQQQQLNHYEHNSHTDNVKKLLHQKITKLLHSIEETNSQADREQLIEMIRLIKGTSDRNWDELVDSLQSENSILDFNRLRSELVEDEPLGVPFGDRSRDDAPARKQHHALPPEYEDHQRLMQHQYDSLRHLHEHKVGRGQEHAAAGDAPGTASVGEESSTKQQQQHHHAHHVVGERVDAHHHLERGPHGSLVIRANEEDQEIHRSRQNGHDIEEKINIHAHELKPNHAGTVVTYDSHHPASSGAGDGSSRQHHQHTQSHHPHHPHHHAGHHAHGRSHEHRGAPQDHVDHGHHQQPSHQATVPADP